MMGSSVENISHSSKEQSRRPMFKRDQDSFIKDSALENEEQKSLIQTGHFNENELQDDVEVPNMKLQMQQQARTTQSAITGSIKVRALGALPSKTNLFKSRSSATATKMTQ